MLVKQYLFSYRMCQNSYLFLFIYINIDFIYTHVVTCKKNKACTFDFIFDLYLCIHMPYTVFFFSFFSSFHRVLFCNVLHTKGGSQCTRCTAQCENTRRGKYRLISFCSSHLLRIALFRTNYYHQCQCQVIFIYHIQSHLRARYIHEDKKINAMYDVKWPSSLNCYSFLSLPIRRVKKLLSYMPFGHQLKRTYRFFCFAFSRNACCWRPLKVRTSRSCMPLKTMGNVEKMTRRQY